MGVTTGKTKTMAVLMDAQAVFNNMKQSVTKLLEGIDNSIRVDLSDDQCWKKADDHLSSASSLDDSIDKNAEILKAQRALRDGMRIDFSDLSKEKVKALLIPDLEKIEKLITECQELHSKLEGRDSDAVSSE